MAKWKPTPKKTHAVIRAGRDARAYRVPVSLERRFRRGMQMFDLLPWLVGFAAAYGVQLLFFTFILPIMVRAVTGLGNYPNVYLGFIYGLGVPIFLVAGRYLAYRFGEKLVAGQQQLDDGLSIIEQRAEALRNMGFMYGAFLIALVAAGIYLGIDQKAKVFYLVTLVGVAGFIEWRVLPKRVQAAPTYEDQPK